MALNCECGRYLGARTVCECGRAVDQLPSDPSTDLDDAWFDETPDSAPLAHTPDPQPADRTEARWGELRGYVAEGTPQRLGMAGGVGLGWLLVLAPVVAVAFVRGPQLIELFTNAAIGLVLMFLGPILLLMFGMALLAKIPGASGCMTALPLLATSWVPRRGDGTGDGWDLVVETPSGLVTARVAANAPLSGDEEVVIHGPVLGGVKHAWLFQCLSPRPYTKVGRGVLRLLVGALVWLPLAVLVLVYV